MSAFDKVIGYSYVKSEMLEILDMLKNPEIYEKLGATLPSGFLLEGEPGLGKTLIAMAFIEESGIKSYILRRSKETKDFIEEMNRVFEDAKRNAPAIILLDDMDKFATAEKNAEEFSVLQANIDSVKNEKVFIIATVNYTKYIPHSLLRSGRFDRTIEILYPSRKDGLEIVKYYVGQKPIGDSVDMNDLAKMLSGKSCADLDVIINMAAISASHERSEKIEMKHLVNATLRDAYGIGGHRDLLSQRELEEVAYHEAGHAVVSDIINEGSVGIVSIARSSKTIRDGFMTRCTDYSRRPHLILVSLGGKAAAELKFGKVASGTFSDLSRASTQVDESTKHTGIYGLANLGFGGESVFQDARSEVVVTAELERYLFKAKEILADNREFLEKVALELLEKETLLNSDIARIRATCTIAPAIIG